MAIANNTPKSLDAELQRLCEHFNVVMWYNVVRDSYTFQFRLHPNGVFIINYECPSYLFKLAKDNIVDVFLNMREQAFSRYDIFYIIQECLRAGKYFNGKN